MRVSKSNKVCGYVKAARLVGKLTARLREKEDELLPLKRDLTEARADVATRRQAMTGGQIGEAERILKSQPELQEVPA